MTPYWTIDHTADLGLLVRAERPQELFIEAAKGLVLLLVGEFQVTPSGWRDVTIKSPEPEIMLAEFLSEILSLAVIEDLAVVEIRIRDFSFTSRRSSLTARLGFSKVKDLGGLKQEIKAVTYHGLSIEKIRTGFEATVILDV